MAIFAAPNHNYNHKQRTLKHRNTQNGSKSTKKELWIIFVFKKFCKKKKKLLNLFLTQELSLKGLCHGSPVHFV